MVIVIKKKELAIGRTRGDKRGREAGIGRALQRKRGGGNGVDAGFFLIFLMVTKKTVKIRTCSDWKI